jgi:hypothetical protein
MGIIGGIGGLLLFAKIIAHLYLLSKVEHNFSLLNYSMYSYAKRGKMLLPAFEDVPIKYLMLKRLINIVYTIAVVGIIAFLIGNTFFKTHGQLD